MRVARPILSAYRADEAHSADVQRAYLRFSWARRQVPRRLPLARWLVAGFVIGVSVASAASLLPMAKRYTATPSESANVVPGLAAHHPAKRAARAEGREPKPPPLVAETSSSERSITEVPSPAFTHKSSAAAPRSSALASAPPSAHASDWQRAAAALRNGNLADAEAALENLEQSEDPLDRQAAELARAQLLVRVGRGAEARRTLEHLAREGGSPVIRSQAASSLRALSD
jgi:hypothetical protein